MTDMKKAILWMAALCLVALQACQKEKETPAVIATGICGAHGDNLTWTLDEEGTLTIKGEGDMEDYDESPWWGIYDEKIVSVVVQDGVTSIGKAAFYWDDYLELNSVTISNSVTRIGEWAFSNCINMTSVNIPENLTDIEAEVFGYCGSLTSITIPENVTNIGRNAFILCTSLTEIRVMAAEPPSIIVDDTSITEDDESTFRGVDTSIPVYVPASSVENYRNSAWGQVFSNIQPM